MNRKDWILLLTPIVANLVLDGIVIFLLQKVVLDRYIKRRLLKDEIVKDFLDSLKSISDHLIEMNFDSMRGVPGFIDKHIPLIQSMFADLAKYYNTNIYDLRKFEDRYNSLNNSWMVFQTTYNDYALKEELTMQMRLDLGNKMQKVFDDLSIIIENVRKNY